MSHQTIIDPARNRRMLRGGRSGSSLDNRFVPPIFITLILLAGQVSYGILESYQKTLLAIATAIITELVLGRFFYGKWPHIRQRLYYRHQRRHPVAFACVLAVRRMRCNRHYIKICIAVQGRHLWNPSNFGICVVLFLLPASVAMLSIQWGNNLWSMVVIWLLGIGHHLAPAPLPHLRYLCISFLGCWPSYAAHGLFDEPVLAEISPVTSPEYQLHLLYDSRS